MSLFMLARQNDVVYSLDMDTANKPSEQKRKQTMQKDFQKFIANKSLANAKKVLKHAAKMSAQCVYFAEIAEARAIVDAA